MSKLQANAEVETHALFQCRWSPRAFDAGKAVSKQDVLRCLEAARWAPSCFGEEPWRFVVCYRQEDEQGWQRLLSCLAPKNQEWAKFAPVLLAICSKSVFSHNGNPNRWSEYDAGQAAVSLCLQATSLGLATHQMGGFDGEALSEKFAIPSEVVPMAVIALGYQGDVQTLEEGFQASELSPRSRKPLSEIIHYGGES